MSQNDFTIANQTFPNTRADINSALQALASNNSGTSAPSTQFANQFWYNSTTNILYIRNEGNDADIPIMELDQTNDTVEYFKSDSVRTALIEFTDGDDALAIADGGALTVSTSLDMNGTELILDTDGDTSIHASTDDQIDIKIAGADDFKFTANTFTALSGSTISIPSGATIANSGTATGFGKVLQVVQGRTKTLFTTASGSLADIGLSAAITPSSSSSKILVICNINGIFFSAVAGSFAVLTLLRGSTNVTGDAAAPYLGYPVGYNSAAVTRTTSQTMSYLDSRSTASAVTYKVQAAQVGGVTINFQRDNQVYSTIQLMEIAG